MSLYRDLHSGCCNRLQCKMFLFKAAGNGSSGTHILLCILSAALVGRRQEKKEIVLQWRGTTASAWETTSRLKNIVMWHFKVPSFWLIRCWVQEELFTKSMTIMWQQKKLFSFPGNSFCWHEELHSNNTAFHKKKICFLKITALNYNAPDFLRGGETQNAAKEKRTPAWLCSG